MKKAYIYSLIALMGAALILSCKKDDENGYEDLLANTNPDIVQALQSQTIRIDIFLNDSNIPEDGTLSISQPSSGTAVIKDNQTPNNLADDYISYTAANDFIGNVTFQYSICNASGNCIEEHITATIIETQVNVDLAQIPYATLSQYQFFKGALSDLEPVYGVLPYEPISSLFSDYAHKKRFVWMPAGTSAFYVGDGVAIDFPIGTILIKSFYYDNVKPNNVSEIIETRLMIKKAEGWIFAEYFWNEDQTEAFIDAQGDGGYNFIEWTENGIDRNLNYRMPSMSECFTCHKDDVNNVPIGVKPQNLNSNFTYSEGSKNQLQQWIDMGYLQDNLPASIETVVNYNDPSQDLELRVRSYFDINCSSCHSDGGHCNYRSMRFAFSENALLENRGVCVTPDTPLPGFEDPKIIKPGDLVNSIVYFRLNTIAEEYRMPLLGRRIIHDEGVALIEEWINSLTNICD